jgi:dCMP deaminase
VIVGPLNDIRATGYNGLPRNIEDAPGRMERPEKYLWIEHAERNAIYVAARSGISLDGCRMYLSWFPCIDCARAIVQVGLSELVAVEPAWTIPPWGEQFVLARELLLEGGVRVRFAHGTDASDVKS